MSERLIGLDRVCFSYPSGPSVLNGASLELSAGERVGLAGPIGSGKTTLLHLIVGLIRPTAGQVEAFGKARRSEADFVEVRRRVGLLFQDSEDQLFCPTVMEDVAFGPLNLGKSRDEAMEIACDTLGSLGLAGYESRISYKLSGGQKRLVSLATVLAMQPEVLLLDEPAAGLDETSADRIIGILAELPQAMIVVAHQRRVLKEIAAHAVLLEDGRLTSGRDWLDSCCRENGAKNA